MSNTIALPLSIGMVLMTRQFAKFDELLTRSLISSGKFGDEMLSLKHSMTQDIMNLSQTGTATPFSLAESLGVVTRSGHDLASAMNVLQVAQQFAVASGGDMVKSTERLMDVQHSLGLRAQESAVDIANLTHITDVFSRASQLAGVSGEVFAESMDKRVGAAMRSFGVSLEEGAAALVIYAREGIVGREAGSALESLLQTMQFAAVSNRFAWDDLGISLFNLRTGQLNPLSEILRQLELRLGPMTEKQRQFTLEILGFSRRTAGMVLPLLGYSEALRKVEASLVNTSEGTTARMAADVMQTLSSQFSLLWNKLSEFGIGVITFMLPVLRAFVHLLGILLNAWKGMDEQTRKSIANYAAFTMSFLIAGKAVQAFIAVSLFLLSPYIQLVGYVFSIAKIFTLIHKGVLLTVSGIMAMASAVNRVISTLSIMQMIFTGFASLFSGLVAVLLTVATTMAIVVGAAYLGLLAWRNRDTLTPYWHGFTASAKEAFSNIRGFLANFGSNMELFMDWLDKNWTTLWENMGSTVGAVLVGTLRKSTAVYRMWYEEMQHSIQNGFNTVFGGRDFTLRRNPERVYTETEDERRRLRLQLIGEHKQQQLLSLSAERDREFAKTVGMDSDKALKRVAELVQWHRVRKESIELEEELLTQATREGNEDFLSGFRYLRLPESLETKLLKINESKTDSLLKGTSFKGTPLPMFNTFTGTTTPDVAKQASMQIARMIGGLGGFHALAPGFSGVAGGVLGAGHAGEDMAARHDLSNILGKAVQTGAQHGILDGFAGSVDMLSNAYAASLVGNLAGVMGPLNALGVEVARTLPAIKDLYPSHVPENQRFQQYNLKQLKLDGPGGLSWGAIPKEQIVHDPRLEKQIFQLIEMMRKQNNSPVGP